PCLLKSSSHSAELGVSSSFLHNSMDHSHLKICITPYNQGNPYQALLANSIVAMGGDVSFAHALKNAASGSQLDFDILHLHWPPQVGRSPVSWARAINYLRRLQGVRRAGKTIVWTVHNATPHESKFTAPDIALARCISHQAA